MQKLNYTYDKKRFETFFDAVIAILLTILVLELRIPEGERTDGLNTCNQIILLLPKFISYLGSFLLIVGIWLDHNILLLNIHQLNKRFILLNMLFVLILSIVPFTTAFAGHHPNDAFAVSLLFINYFVMNLSYSNLYWYANRSKILPLEFFSENKATAIFSMIGILVLVVAIPLAFVNTYLSFGLGLIIFTVHLCKKR